jgi:FKBP-type peptidyl-prolyl cis-trans isomerase
MIRRFSFFAVAAALFISACSSPDSMSKEDESASEASGITGASGMMTSATGLMHKINSPGDGATIKNGDVAIMHYTGWLFDEAAPENKGAKFDSSVDRGQTFDFTLGAGQVISGWDEGVLGMVVGEKRTLVIPPELGYGARGAGGVIPPNATLLFDIELVNIGN